MTISSIRVRLAGTALISAAVLGLAAHAASAASMTVQDALVQFNGIAKNDFYSSQEVEGRLYVGGNLTGNTLQVGFTPLAASPYDALVVNGQTTVGTINVENGTDITVRGNANSNINMNGNGTAHIGGSQTPGKVFNTGTKLQNQAVADPNFDNRFPEIDFTSFMAESHYLSTLSGVAPDLSDYNNKKFAAGTPDGAGLSVIQTSAAALNGGGFTFNLGAASTLLINVSGADVTMAGNVLGSYAGASSILWNFYEATSISVNAKIVGSVLAPLADMSGFQGSTEGSVIAKSIYLSNGEIHNVGFTGRIPTLSAFPDPMPSPSAVPLPAGLPLLIAGVVAIGGLRVRRKTTA